MVGIPVVGLGIVLFVVLVVVDGNHGIIEDVGEGRVPLLEQAVVVALLELAGFPKAACSSFSGHVVTCLYLVATFCRTRHGPCASKRSVFSDRGPISPRAGYAG